jgi:hypothetical protein
MARAEFSEATLMWPSMSDWSPVVAFPKPGVVAFPKPGVALGKRNSLRCESRGGGRGDGEWNV